MGKLVGVELRKMSRCRLVWGVALFILGTSSLTAFKDTYDYAAYTRYANFEYMMYTHATARVFSALTILVSAYVGAEDFAMRTVQNVLSVGIGRVKYYVSKLLAQMLFIFGLYGAGAAVYVGSRVILTGGLNRAMPAGEYLVIFLVTFLQLGAYVAMADLVCVLIRNQAAAMAVGETWLYLSLVLRVFWMEGTPLTGIVAYEPLTVLERFADDYVGTGKVFSAEFFLCGLCALCIIILSSALGCFWFVHKDVQQAANPMVR